MPGWDEFKVVPKTSKPVESYGSVLDQFDLDALDRLRGPKATENRAVNAATNFIQTGMNNFENLGPIKEQINQLDPDVAQRERGKLSGIGHDMAQGAGAINKVKNNVPEAAPLIEQEQEKHPVLKQIVAPVAKGLEYLDNVTSRPVRALTYPGGSNFDWEAAKDSKDWNKAIRSTEVGKGIGTGLDGVMAPLSTIVGLPLSGVGALADIKSGKDASTVGANALETQKNMIHAGGDFAMDAAADWTNLFSLGLGGSAKAVLGPITRAALKAGKSANEAARIAKDVETIAKFNFPVAEKAKYVTDLLKAEGLPQVFGETAQHLGKGQLKVGLDIPGQLVEQVGKAIKSSGLENFGQILREGIDVLPNLTGKEFVGANALDKVLPKVKALTLPPLSPPAQQAFSFMPAPTPPIPQKPLLWSQRGQQKEILKEGILKQKGAINASTADVMNNVVAGAKAAGAPLPINEKFVKDIREAGKAGVVTDEIAKSKQSLIDLAQQNGLPVDNRALQLIEDFHKSHDYASASHWLEQSNLPNAALAAKGLEWLTSKLRRNMLTLSPANNAINIANDIIQASTAGMNNAPLRLSQAAHVLDDVQKPLEIGGKVYQPGELKKLAQEFNIGYKNVNKDVINNKLGSLSKGNNLRIAGDLMSGGILERLPDKVAQKIPMTMQHQHRWEDLSKTALFLERLDRGDAPFHAAKMVFDTLIDYNDAGKMLQIAKWFLPFITWTAKMPVVAGKALVRNPAAFQRPFKAAHALGGEEQSPPSLFRQEQGTSIPLTPRGEQVMGELSGLEGKNLGQTRVRARIPMDEGLSPWLSLTEGNIKPFLAQAGFGSRTVIGGGLNINPVTGKPDDQSLGDMTANAVPSLLFSRPMQEALNYGIYKAHGGKEAGANPAPLSEFGKPSANPEAKQLERILGLLGVGSFKTLPTDQLYNQLDAGELQKLLTRVKNLTNRNNIVETVKEQKGNK